MIDMAQVKNSVFNTLTVKCLKNSDARIWNVL